jgi:hypothetical protein
LGKVWHSARRLSLDINLMMLIAASGAATLGQWSEAGAIVLPCERAPAAASRTKPSVFVAVPADGM